MIDLLLQMKAGNSVFVGGMASEIYCFMERNSLLTKQLLISLTVVLF